MDLEDTVNPWESLELGLDISSTMEDDLPFSHVLQQGSSSLHPPSSTWLQLSTPLSSQGSLLHSSTWAAQTSREEVAASFDLSLAPAGIEISREADDEREPREPPSVLSPSPVSGGPEMDSLKRLEPPEPWQSPSKALQLKDGREGSSCVAGSGCSGCICQHICTGRLEVYTGPGHQPRQGDDAAHQSRALDISPYDAEGRLQNRKQGGTTQHQQLPQGLRYDSPHEAPGLGLGAGDSANLSKAASANLMLRYPEAGTPSPSASSIRASEWDRSPVWTPTTVPLTESRLSSPGLPLLSLSSLEQSPPQTRPRSRLQETSYPPARPPSGSAQHRPRAPPSAHSTRNSSAMSASSQKELATLLAKEIVRELDRSGEGEEDMIARDAIPLPPARRTLLSTGRREGQEPRSLDFLVDISRGCKDEAKKKAKKKGSSGEARMGMRQWGQCRGMRRA